MTGTAAATPPGLLYLIYGRQITDIYKKKAVLVVFLLSYLVIILLYFSYKIISGKIRKELSLCNKLWFSNHFIFAT